jgi:hypothetical protein
MPDRYWQPWLGEACGVRPCDIGDLTPHQLLACHKWAVGRGVLRG